MLVFLHLWSDSLAFCWLFQKIREDSLSLSIHTLHDIFYLLLTILPISFNLKLAFEGIVLLFSIAGCASLLRGLSGSRFSRDRLVVTGILCPSSFRFIGSFNSPVYCYHRNLGQWLIQEWDLGHNHTSSCLPKSTNTNSSENPWEAPALAMSNLWTWPCRHDFFFFPHSNPEQILSILGRFILPEASFNRKY